MSNLGVFADQLKAISSNKRPREEDNETTCLSDNEDAWQRRRTKKTEAFLKGYDRGQLKAALMESHYMSSVLINRRRDIENFMKKYDEDIPNHEEELKAKEDQLKLKDVVINNLEVDISDLDQELRLTRDVLNAFLRELILLNNKMSKEFSKSKEWTTVVDTNKREILLKLPFLDNWKKEIDDFKIIIDKYTDYDKLIENLKK